MVLEIFCAHRLAPFPGLSFVFVSELCVSNLAGSSRADEVHGYAACYQGCGCDGAGFYEVDPC